MLSVKGNESSPPEAGMDEQRKKIRAHVLKVLGKLNSQQAEALTSESPSSDGSTN